MSRQSDDYLARASPQIAQITEIVSGATAPSM
jgi:hypothetical protein